MPTFKLPPPVGSEAPGVGHDPLSLSDMRRADARSADIKSPDGVARCFQVSVNKVEPSEAVFTRNLFSKNCDRFALCNEVVPVRPEVPLVSKPKTSASPGERLARAGSRPDFAVIRPSCKSEGIRPTSESCKEVALRVFSKVIGPDITYISLVNITGRYAPGGYQVAQPLGHVRIYLVVISGHRFSFL